MRSLPTLIVMLAASQAFAQDTPIAFSATANAQVKTAAAKLIQSGSVVVNVDKVDGAITIISALDTNRSAEYFNNVCLGAVKLRGEDPVLFLEVKFGSDDWLFAKAAKFNVAGQVISLNDEHPKRSVNRFGPGVTEQLSWAADTKDAQIIIKAILSGRRVLCQLEGERKVALSDIRASELSNVLTVYFALGGKPLNL